MAFRKVALVDTRSIADAFGASNVHVICCERLVSGDGRVEIFLETGTQDFRTAHVSGSYRAYQACQVVVFNAGTFRFCMSCGQ